MPPNVDWLSNLLLEQSRSDIDDVAVVHVSAAFPRQVPNDPVGHIHSGLDGASDTSYPHLLHQCRKSYYCHV
jgi:hypothetical protein